MSRRGYASNLGLRGPGFHQRMTSFDATADPLGTYMSRRDHCRFSKMFDPRPMRIRVHQRITFFDATSFDASPRSILSNAFIDLMLRLEASCRVHSLI